VELNYIFELELQKIWIMKPNDKDMDSSLILPGVEIYIGLDIILKQGEILSTEFSVIACPVGHCSVAKY